MVCSADNPAEPKTDTSWQLCPGSARTHAPPPAGCALQPAHTGEPPHKPPLETPPAILFGPRKGQLLKWPAFTPPRAAALCRRPVADYSSAAYTRIFTAKLPGPCRDARHLAGPVSSHVLRGPCL